VLKRRDVTAVEVRQPQVEHTVAEGEARIDQGGPGLIADDAVLGQIAGCLKRPHGLHGCPEEDAVHSGATEVVSEGEQSALYVLDRGSSVPGPYGSHR